MHLNFRIIFRESKTNFFPEHLVFLTSGDIEEDHIRRCPISEREKQDPPGTKMVVKVKHKGSTMWEN